jgi:hypothetical protein
MSSEEETNMASLTIVRDSGYADRLRNYQVMLDGNKVGQLGNSETKQFSVSPGHHRLSLKIDWCGSKPVEFDVEEKDDLVFQARSALRGHRVFRALWYAIFAPSSYILVEQSSFGAEFMHDRPS